MYLEHEPAGIVSAPAATTPLARLLRRMDGSGDAWLPWVRTVAEETCRRLDAELAHLYLLDPATGALNHAGAWDGEEADLPPAGSLDTPTLRLGQALPGRACADRSVTRSDDLHGDAETRGDPRGVPDEVRAAIAVPLLGGGSALGALEFWFRSPAAAEAADATELEVIARVLGESLSRIRAEQRLALADRGAPLERTDADPLTGLATRALFKDSLRRAIDRARLHPDFRFAVLFVDLDGFKLVNDTFGHALGDRVLAAAARTIEGAVRPGDLVARYGGDEFVTLIELVGGVQDALTVAERVCERLTRLGGHAPDLGAVGASIGIALSESGYDDPARMVADADAAMYLAKRSGGGFRIFDAALQEAAVATRRVRGELHGAFENGELRVHYQPMVDACTGRIAAIEAFLRWQHPERGLLPAAEFIGQAEEMGLILPMGRWTLAEACRQIRLWQRDASRSAPLVVSVNVSVRELADPRFAATVEAVLAETGVDPRSLRLEIANGFLERRDARALLWPLIAQGVRLGIGDFGWVSCSVEKLSALPADLVKIDRRLIAEIDGSGGRHGKGRVIRSILGLAQGLGIDVAAEGVETPAQRETLRWLGCPYLQGSLIHPPADAAAITSLLRPGAAVGRPRTGHTELAVGAALGR